MSRVRRQPSHRPALTVTKNADSRNIPIWSAACPMKVPVPWSNDEVNVFTIAISPRSPAVRAPVFRATRRMISPTMRKPTFDQVFAGCVTQAQRSSSQNVRLAGGQSAQGQIEGDGLTRTPAYRIPRRASCSSASPAASRCPRSVAGERAEREGRPGLGDGLRSLHSFEAHAGQTAHRRRRQDAALARGARDVDVAVGLDPASRGWRVQPVAAMTLTVRLAASFEPSVQVYGPAAQTASASAAGRVAAGVDHDVTSTAPTDRENRTEQGRLYAVGAQVEARPPAHAGKYSVARFCPSDRIFFAARSFLIGRFSSLVGSPMALPMFSIRSPG